MSARETAGWILAIPVLLVMLILILKGIQQDMIMEPKWKRWVVYLVVIGIVGGSFYVSVIM